MPEPSIGVELGPKPDIREIARKIRRESEGPDPNLEAFHDLAQEQRIRFLKTDPSFRAMLRVLSRMPSLQQEILAIIRSKEGFKENTVKELGVRGVDVRGRPIKARERHRDLTALFAGLLSSREGRDLFEWALERSINAEAAQIKAAIRAGKNRTREIVVGTGIHATGYETERKIYRPDDPSLMVDKETHIGGQFAQADGDLWGLNSRKRPKDLNEAPIPGTKGALNDLGDHAVMQESDVGNLSYDSQAPLARANEVNCRLSGGQIMNETRVLSCRQDPRTNELIVTSIDEKTGELYTTKHERMVYMGGLGDEIVGLDEDDPETAEILSEAREELARGEIPQVLTFPMYEKIASDRADAFPLDGIKDAVVVADGDGTRIIAGALLGHEYPVGKQSTQLHFLNKLTWIGQPAKTRKEYFGKERPRYVTVGQDFPRTDEADNYYSRIETKPGLRAARLRRNGRKIEVICTNSEGVYVSGGMGDRVFLATGFRDTFEQKYGAIYATAYTTVESIRLNLPFFLQRVGNAIRYKSGPYKGCFLEVVDIQPERIEAPTITCRLLARNGARETYTFKNTRLGRRDAGIETLLQQPLRNSTDLSENVAGFFSAPGNFLEFSNGNILEVVGAQPRTKIPGRTVMKLTRTDGTTQKVTLERSDALLRAFFASDYASSRDIEQVSIVPSQLPPAEVITNTKGKPIARQAAPANSNSNFGPEIYIGGPPAKLPLTEAEKELPAFKIGPNTASIFRYIGPTQELARKLATRDRQNARKSSKNDLPREFPQEQIKLPAVARMDRRDVSFMIPRTAPRGRDRFPHDGDPVTALRLAVAEISSRYNIPRSFFERTNGLVLSIKWDARPGATKQEYKVTMQPGLSEPYRKFAQALLEDPLVQSILAFLMHRKRGLQDVTLRIPTRRINTLDSSMLKKGSGIDDINRRTVILPRFDVGNITYTTG